MWPEDLPQGKYLWFGILIWWGKFYVLEVSPWSLCRVVSGGQSDEALTTHSLSFHSVSQCVCCRQALVSGIVELCPLLCKMVTAPVYQSSNTISTIINTIREEWWLPKPKLKSFIRQIIQFTFLTLCDYHHIKREMTDHSSHRSILTFSQYLPNEWFPCKLCKILSTIF